MLKKSSCLKSIQNLKLKKNLDSKFVFQNYDKEK